MFYPLNNHNITDEENPPIIYMYNPFSTEHTRVYKWTIKSLPNHEYAWDQKEKAL